ERLERPQAELLDQPQDPVLRGPDPLAADLDDLAVPEIVVEGPPPDAVARLQHHERLPRLLQLPAGGQPGEPGADDDDVHLAGTGRGLGGRGGTADRVAGGADRSGPDEPP